MTDWVEIVALVTGPVLAVGLSLWRERVRQERERKLNVMRQLLITRSNAADAAFSTAVNLVPVEFGHIADVMTAWEGFTHAAGHQIATTDLVNELAKQMMLALRYSDRAASQVARESYTSVALADQRKLFDGALKGMVSVARSSKLSAKAAKAVAEQVTGKKMEDTEDEISPDKLAN